MEKACGLVGGVLLRRSLVFHSVPHKTKIINFGTETLIKIMRCNKDLCTDQTLISFIHSVVYRTVYIRRSSLKAENRMQNVFIKNGTSVLTGLQFKPGSNCI